MECTLEIAIAEYTQGFMQGFNESFYQTKPTLPEKKTAFYWAGVDDGINLAYLFLELPEDLLRQVKQKIKEELQAHDDQS